MIEDKYKEKLRIIKKLHMIEDFLREKDVSIRIYQANTIEITLSGYKLYIKNSSFPREVEEDKIYFSG